MERNVPATAGWAGEQVELAQARIRNVIDSFRGLDRLTSIETRKVNVQLDDLWAEVERLRGAYQRLMERTAGAAMRPQG